MFLTVANATTIEAHTDDDRVFQVTDAASAEAAVRAELGDDRYMEFLVSSTIHFPEEWGMDKETCEKLLRLINEAYRVQVTANRAR